MTASFLHPDDLRAVGVPRVVQSIGNARTSIDRVTTVPGVAMPLHAYMFVWPSVDRPFQVERVSLPLAVPTADGTLTTGITPEVLITAALDAYQQRAMQGMADDVTQRARLANMIGMLRAALTEAEAYAGGADGRAPLEALPVAS